MAVANRFDLAAASEEARKKKEAEKMKKIISIVVLAIMVLVVAIGGWIGFNFWMDKRREAREAQEAEEARLEAERAKKLKAQREKAAADKAKRDQQRKEQEAARKRQAFEREQTRKREIEARERERQEKELAKRREREEKIEQAELRKYSDELLASLRPTLANRVTIDIKYRGEILPDCEDERWVNLVSYAASKNATLFLDLIKPDSLTNAPPLGGNLPGRHVFADALRKLDAETFTMTLRFEPSTKFDGVPCVCELSPEKGIVVPEGFEEVKEERKVVGWKFPFTYGERTLRYVMDTSDALRFRKEWNRQVKDLERQQKRKGNDADWLAEQKRLVTAALAKDISTKLNTKEEEPVVTKKAEPEKRSESKIGGFKGPSERAGSSNSGGYRVIHSTGNGRESSGRLGEGGRIGGGIRHLN